MSGEYVTVFENKSKRADWRLPRTINGSGVEILVPKKGKVEFAYPQDDSALYAPYLKCVLIEKGEEEDERRIFSYEVEIERRKNWNPPALEEGKFGVVIEWMTGDPFVKQGWFILQRYIVIPFGIPVVLWDVSYSERGLVEYSRVYRTEEKIVRMVNPNAPLGYTESRSGGDWKGVVRSADELKTIDLLRRKEELAKGELTRAAIQEILKNNKGQ